MSDARPADLNVRLIPVLQNNVAYLLIQGNEAVVVDPGEAEPVWSYVRAHGLRLADIWITHGHPDHIGGVARLQAATGARLTTPVGLSLPGVDRMVGEGDVVPLGSCSFRVWWTPGHQALHVAYVRGSPAPTLAFVGDTLFGAGCGRLFGLPPEQLYETLCRLNTLPEDSLLFCGHDLAEQNLLFAQVIEPDNAAIQTRLAAVRQRSRRGEPNMPLRLGEERATNPFLRTEVEAVRNAVGLPQASALEVFAELRRRKDNF